MRELFWSLSELESRLMQSHGVSLNEAMVLCAIGKERVAASTIVERTGLTPSHASKVIRAVEERNLLVRALGEKDKRQMYFSLTKEAHNCLKGIREQGIDIPELLQPLFASYAEGVSDSCE